MKPKKDNSFSNKILEQIEKGKVAMTPRWHFVLKAVLFALGGCILLLLALYMISFAFFTLREGGLFGLPAFGFHGAFLLVSSLPWILILASLVFVVLLEVLVRKYSFAYRKPLLFSVGVIVLLITLGGIVVEKTELHDRVWRLTKEQPLPFIDQLYRDFVVSRGKEVHPVIIATTTETGFMAVDRDGDTITVFIGSSTRLPAGFDFEEGDEVMVLGEQSELSGSTTIEATGVKPMHRGKTKRKMMRERPSLMHTR